MARKQSLISRLSVFLLLAPSCAWASTYDEVTRHEKLSGKRLELRDGGDTGIRGEKWPVTLWKRVEAEVMQVVEEQISLIIATNSQPKRQQQQQHDRREAAPSPAAFVQAQITPPPALSLYKRQNDGQIAQLSAQIQSISQASRQVSQASQQVSQSSQQLSNSLQQAQQQLSQTAQSLASARASADSSRQSAETANQARDKASRDADQARQSADRAVASASSSASVAAEAASSNAASSAASSVASMVAAMSQSAQAVMSSAASLVQAAKADATAVRTDADNRVLQAQGAAVSVTQAALAIVGAIIGSSLLTIAAFVFILRLKRRRRDRRSMAAIRGTADIDYPALNATTTNITGGNTYPPDPKPPQPALTKVAFPAQRKSFHLRQPPKGKFTLFPKNKERDEERGTGSPTSDYGPENEKARVRGSTMDSPPSLEKWMRNGTTVSPFGTLVKGAGTNEMERKGGNWPLDRKGGG